ncbi:MAG: RNA polymerase sigma factor [Bacteroidota bacterium]
MNQDQALLKAIIAKDPQAFESFYEAYKSKVYNTCLSYTQNEEDAEEITQDVFVEVFNSAQKFQGKSSLSTWVYRICINKSLDFLRYKKRKKRFAQIQRLWGGEKDEALDLPDFKHPGILAENQEKATILFRAIETLPENQKNAFILSFVEELPRKEVADIMKIKLKACESLLQRAKGNLRKKLEKFYEEERNS